MYGNMSSVEKAMNKEEMEAFKNYDQRQYSLIPGLQHSKQIKSPVAHSTKLLGSKNL